MTIATSRTRPRLLAALAWSSAVVLCMIHGLGIWIAMGRWQGITQPWPLAMHDHPEHFHNATIARALVRASGTTSGYDPSFMAGYAKSILSDSSATISDIAVGLIGGGSPIVAYKIYVFIAAALAPWLLLGAGALWRASPVAVGVGLLLALVYMWSDMPIKYVQLGMTAYFLSVPLGLFAIAVFTEFLRLGGFRWWAASAAALALLLLVHATSPMLAAPAAGVAYLVALFDARRSGARFPASRHLGVWALPVVALAANAFWWLPGLWLAATRGRSDLAFSHPEPISGRLLEMMYNMPPIEGLLCGGLLMSVPFLGRKSRPAGAALAAFLAAGFFWGYLAGARRELDALQPGRHTYAFYTGAALSSGIAFAELLARLRTSRGGRPDLWFAAGALVIAIRVLAPTLEHTAWKSLAGPQPFLSSRPSLQLRRLVEKVREHVPKGSRLLYEEGGRARKQVPDIFNGDRYSGLLPYMTGVEVIGGPFLHVTLASNFTQFGEGKLFGRERWDRDHFVRYARLYRPSAIVCWSIYARAFCKANSDLIKVIDDDGMLLIGRIEGFEGSTIEGRAAVEARPGRLRVRPAETAEGAPVVLRYHATPCLRVRPPTPWEPVFLEDDPVPFIRLRPRAGTTEITIGFPPEGDEARTFTASPGGRAASE